MTESEVKDWERVWLPSTTRRCKQCGYKKHASGQYDEVRDGVASWPHWHEKTAVERDEWKERALRAEEALDRVKKIAPILIADLNLPIQVVSLDEVKRALG